MKRGSILRDVHVEKLVLGGKGFAEASDGKKIFITGGAIPGSKVSIRITKSRKAHYEGQIVEVEKRSDLEKKLPDHWQVYGGCKWLPISYEDQLSMKEQMIKEVFHMMVRSDVGSSAVFHDIVPSPETEGYRNKVEFSWGKYISAKEEIHAEYRFGFHAPGSFDRIIDCSYCVLGDKQVNNIFDAFDCWAKESGLPTYDQKVQKGFWRHLVIRQGKKTGECMVVLSVNSPFLKSGDFKSDFIAFLTSLDLGITSAYLLHNSGKADIVDGDFEHVFGSETITESLSVGDRDLEFEVAPKSFFQTNPLGAEKLYQVVRDLIQTQGGELYDLYAGTGTIGSVLADRFDQVYSVELVESASQDNERNLKLNRIDNVEVINSKVEDFLESDVCRSSKKDAKQKTVVIDPPRAGMHPSAPGLIPQFEADEIIYVSCNPATLVRDLELICEKGSYTLTDVTPVDMFPHTHHVECVARLQVKK